MLLLNVVSWSALEAWTTPPYLVSKVAVIWPARSYWNDFRAVAAATIVVACWDVGGDVLPSLSTYPVWVTDTFSAPGFSPPKIAHPSVPVVELTGLTPVPVTLMFGTGLPWLSTTLTTRLPPIGGVISLSATTAGRDPIPGQVTVDVVLM